MLKIRKRLFYIILGLLLVVVLLFSPVCALIRSCFIMFPYSYIHQKDSVLHKNKIIFNIPGGFSTKKPDWYPFMITFNDNEGLSAYLGEPVEFTVLYNFGHFQPKEGSSSYYNPQSPYYSSFYGGYIVKPEAVNRKFGFHDDNTIHTEELAKIPEFDQLHLVLSSLGCPADKKVFKENILSIQYEVNYAGYHDWIRIDSEIETNSPVHGYQGFQPGYLQYGKPMGRFLYDEDFPVIQLKGRVYVRYSEEFQATMVLYAMSPSWEIIDEVDREMLSKTEIAVPDAEK